MMTILKFKKNESFYIRDGWFEKAINTINEFKGQNIFSKNNGITYLGIGSNMVKGLKYWLNASGIIKKQDNQLTEFGELLLQYDQYLESDFSWYLIHLKLCSNLELCPVFYSFFNNNIQSFDKNLLVKYLHKDLKKYDNEIKDGYIEADLNVFLKSYINDSEEIQKNPEDNYVCPLSSLNLIVKSNNIIRKAKPIYNSLSYLIIYYALTLIYKKNNTFDINESFQKEKSPYLIFNLDKNAYFQYLDEMQNNKLIIINRTAGINTVEFKEKLELKVIFKKYFEGKR